MGEIYKWSTPHKWLVDKVFEWSHDKLRVEYIELAYHLDSHTLKGIYKPEMVKDGYFETIKTKDNS